MYTQTTPEFPELAGSVTFTERDQITFTEGLVDIHSHGRDNNRDLGNAMTDVLSHSVKQFGMVLLMPNLVGKDALMTPDMATAYYTRAVAAANAPLGQFKILVTVYLNTDLTEDNIKLIAESPHIAGVKFYPAHATTNSEHGLRTPLDAPKQLGWMEKYGVTLFVHGQTRTAPDGSVLDEWDREPHFYEYVFPKLDEQYPALRISCEHLSTTVGMQAVAKRKGPTFGTCTLLHLGYTRTFVMDSGVYTPAVMKPMVQHERELLGIWRTLKANPEKFGLGSDDAWHGIEKKHATTCACGGCYGPYRIGFYLDIFERNEALGLFGRFACANAARFHNVEVPRKTVTMQKGHYEVAKTLPFGNTVAEPLHTGESRFGWHQTN